MADNRLSETTYLLTVNVSGQFLPKVGHQSQHNRVQRRVTPPVEKNGLYRCAKLSRMCECDYEKTAISHAYIRDRPTVEKTTQ